VSKKKVKIMTEDKKMKQRVLIRNSTGQWILCIETDLTTEQTLEIVKVKTPHVLLEFIPKEG
jgi:hypothetical protein